MAWLEPCLLTVCCLQPKTLLFYIKRKRKEKSHGQNPESFYKIFVLYNLFYYDYCDFSLRRMAVWFLLQCLLLLLGVCC